MTKIIYMIILIFLIVLGFYGIKTYLDFKDTSQRVENIPQITPTPQQPQTPKEDTPLLSSVATNLEVPWALTFLPNGDILVTERKGRLNLIAKNEEIKEVGQIAVKQVNESGLHGIAIHPKFEQNQYIYLYYTYSQASDNTFNRVSRFTFDGQSIKDEKIIVDKIPGATIHDGGRIKFGPDGYLYLTTGDAANPSLAQDKNSLAGKILRVKDEGKVEMYSYGHRNPQGIAWDNQNRLWETEHGQSATDEVNLIEEGKNYGWPTIRGDQTQDGMVSPKIHSGSVTWAPAGVASYQDSIFYGGLRGQALFQLNLGNMELKEHFRGQLGRIRDVVLGPDNMLYITTSNRDGRGNPSPDDDKILIINPSRL